MHDKLEIKTLSANQTLDFGRSLGRLIDRPTVIALTGDLGSGKTVLVKGIAEGLGVPAGYRVTSPTYTIINEYEGRYRLFHIDLYRLGKDAGIDDDAADIGLDDILDGGGVVAIEWAEYLDNQYFMPDIAINIRATGENERIFSVFFYRP